MGLEDDDYNELNDLLKKHSEEFKSQFMKNVDSNKNNNE
jgi:hypothetical protein